MSEAAVSTIPRWAVIVLGALCVAAAATASALFLPRQSLWNDEATQMSGLTLDPGGQVRWLTGREHHDFGVAEDRMPPISYWLGWVWSRAFGLNEPTMRALGLTATALGTLLVFAAGRRAWGLEAGTAAALLFGLSPNVVVTAVEIRAYPLFLLTSSWLFYCLIRLLDDPVHRQGRWLVGMTASALAGVFTHYFGLVAAGGAFLAALVLAPRRGGRLGPVVACCAVVGLASIGLLPFVAASANMSSAEPRPTRLMDVVRLFYRLVLHASMRLNLAATAAAAVGVICAAISCLAPPSRGRDARLGLILAWASGTLVVISANFVVSSFHPLASNYNSWMYPALALILGSALAAESRWARGLARAGVAMTIGGLLYGDFNLATRGEAFAHTSFSLIDDAVRRYGPDRTVVIYDDAAANPWSVYAPLRYTYAGALPQYILAKELDGRIRLLDYPEMKHEVDLASIPGEYAVVVRLGTRSAEDVVQQLNDGYREIGDGASARFLKGAPDWTLIEEGRKLTFLAAEIDVLRRKPAATGTDARPGPSGTVAP